MDATWIISLFRTRCSNITTSELSDSTALAFANVGYQNVINTIRSKVNEDFGSDIWTRDTVIGQNEYSFDTRGDDTSLVAPINKITKVAIKYTADGEYKLATPFSVSTQVLDDTALGTVASTGNPIYRIQDYSAFIFPTPTEAVVWGVKVYGLYDPIPLTLSTIEANIMVPPSHQWVITSHMLWLYYESSYQSEKRQIAYNNMLIDEQRMITELSNRVNGQLEQQLPNIRIFS